MESSILDPWIVDGAVDDSPQALAGMFAAVGAHLAAFPDTPAVLESLTDLATAMVPGARWSSITRGRSDGFVSLAASDPVAAAADQVQYELGTGPCLDAVLDDAVFSSNDLALDSRWSHFGPQVARDLGIRSVLSLRLTMETVEGDDDPNAALNLYGDHRDAFDGTSRFLATMLATHAALSVAVVVNRENAAHLQVALASSREIGTAMGVLMTRHQLTREQAFGLLRLASQNTNRKLRDVAAEVADTGTLDLPASRRRD